MLISHSGKPLPPFGMISTMSDSGVCSPCPAARAWAPLTQSGWGPRSFPIWPFLFPLPSHLFLYSSVPFVPLTSGEVPSRWICTWNVNLCLVSVSNFHMTLPLTSLLLHSLPIQMHDPKGSLLPSIMHTTHSRYFQKLLEEEIVLFQINRRPIRKSECQPSQPPHPHSRPKGEGTPRSELGRQVHHRVTCTSGTGVRWNTAFRVLPAWYTPVMPVFIIVGTMVCSHKLYSLDVIRHLWE